MAQPVTRKTRKYTRGATPTDPTALPAHVRAELEKVQAAQPNTNTVVVTAAYTATIDDRVLLVDTSAGNVTITLFTAAKRLQLPLTIVKTSSDVHTVTVAASGTEKINGAATLVISTQYATYTIAADGAGAWSIIGSAGVASGVISAPQWTVDSSLTLPSAPNAKDDEFDGAAGAAVSAAWTMLNGGGTSTAKLDGKGRLVFKPQLSAGNNWVILEKAPPATPWKATIRCFLNNSVVGPSVGIALRNSVSGKIIVFEFFLSSAWTPAFGIFTYTNFTTFSATILATTTSPLVVPGPFMRVVNDGTTLTFQLSWIGTETDHWQTVATQALATFIGSVDQFGIGLKSGSGTIQGVGIVDFFRVS